MEELTTTGKPFWKSKKWLTAAIAAIIPITNAVFGLDLDTAEVITIILPLIIYIYGQAKVDAEH